MSMTSSKLLMSTKTMMADPNAPNSKNLLAQAARLVKNNNNKIVDIFCNGSIASFLDILNVILFYHSNILLMLFVPI